MSGIGSLLLFCAWAAGLVAGFLTIRSFEEPVTPAGPRRQATMAIAGAVVATLWLPWVTSANGQFTSSGWFALDAATVVALVLLAAGVATLAARPDWGGAHRDEHSLVLSLSLLGIIAGNWLIGASGGWGNHLRWGATVSLILAAALAAVEGVHFLHGRTATAPDDTLDLTRLNDLPTS